jgi:hypothetical protein
MLSQNLNGSTDYLEVSKKISALTKDHPKTYSQCVDALLDTLATIFPPLNYDTNPVVTNLDNWGADDLAFVIKEYSVWSNETIHMFLDARIRMYWDGMRKEIDRNVGEEMGALTNNVPHLELMRQAYSKELGIETDNVPYSAITQDFVTRMRQLFKHKDNAFLAGALLAFEATATDEFRIVNSFLRRRKKLLGGDITRGSVTYFYVSEHVAPEDIGSNPEDSHYEGLQNSIEPYINSDNIHRFINGFLSVCLTMNTWWERLVVETYYQRICQESLAVHDPEIIDVSLIIKGQTA